MTTEEIEDLAELQNVINVANNLGQAFTADAPADYTMEEFEQRVEAVKTDFGNIEDSTLSDAIKAANLAWHDSVKAAILASAATAQVSINTFVGTDTTA